MVIDKRTDDRLITWRESRSDFWRDQTCDSSCVKYLELLYITINCHYIANVTHNIAITDAITNCTLRTRVRQPVWDSPRRHLLIRNDKRIDYRSTVFNNTNQSKVPNRFQIVHLNINQKVCYLLKNNCLKKGMQLFSQRNPNPRKLRSWLKFWSFTSGSDGN